MKITVFGSAFDPPHIGHEIIINTLLGNQLVDEVWLLPAKYHASGKSMVSEHHRLAMLKLVTRPGVKIELYELNQSSINYTYNSLLAIYRHHPDHTFSFVMGADKLIGFDHWVEYRQLLERFPVWVFPRRGFELGPLYDGMSVIQKVEPLEVSSTLVRDLVKAGRPLGGLVNNQIAVYIVEHDLYV